jgi:hypothetical protein
LENVRREYGNNGRNGKADMFSILFSAPSVISVFSVLSFPFALKPGQISSRHDTGNA